MYNSAQENLCKKPWGKMPHSLETTEGMCYNVNKEKRTKDVVIRQKE